MYEVLTGKSLRKWSPRRLWHRWDYSIEAERTCRNTACRRIRTRLQV